MTKNIFYKDMFKVMVIEGYFRQFVFLKSTESGHRVFRGEGCRLGSRDGDPWRERLGIETSGSYSFKYPPSYPEISFLALVVVSVNN